MKDFTILVLAIVRRIPPGRVATYGDVAAAAGRPRAARAVGTVMRGCGRPDVPCHRVVAANGRLGGYGGNIGMKRALLQAEGLRVVGLNIKDFSVRRWRAPGKPPPARTEASTHPVRAPAGRSPRSRYTTKKH